MHLIWDFICEMSSEWKRQNEKGEQFDLQLVWYAFIGGFIEFHERLHTKNLHVNIEMFVLFLI